MARRVYDSHEPAIENLEKEESELSLALEQHDEIRERLTVLQNQVKAVTKDLEGFTGNIHDIEVKLAQLGQEGINIEQNLYSEFMATP